MNKKRHLIVASLEVLVLLQVGIFGTLILTASGVGSSSKMIEHTGLIGGGIGFKITAPYEAYPNEPSYVKVEVYQPVPGAVYIEFITARVHYSWTLEETLVEDKNLTGDAKWSVIKTFYLSDAHVPMPSWLGKHILCDLDFSIHNYSLNYTGRDLLTFSLSLVTEKTGEVSEGYPLNTQILTYALAGATVLFMATTIYFARRKPKSRARG